MTDDEKAETPEAAAEAAVDDRAPRRRKKKRRRKRKAEPATPRREPLDADGRERPRFLLDFPEHPELERVIRAFEAGDYARVRREAPALAERADDPAVRDAALELARRIDPDPLAKYLLVASIALLLFLVVWVYTTHSP